MGSGTNKTLQSSCRREFARISQDIPTAECKSRVDDYTYHFQRSEYLRVLKKEMILPSLLLDLVFLFLAFGGGRKIIIIILTFHHRCLFF
jgi:hypothetical protein